MRYTVENFKKDIEKADAIRVDGGPLLDNWTSENEEVLVTNWCKDDLETIANNLEDWFNYSGKEITVLITNIQ